METGESSRTNLRRWVTGSRMSLNLGVFGVDIGGWVTALWVGVATTGGDVSVLGTLTV